MCNKDLSECLRLKGIIHRDYGNLTLAEEALSEALSIANLMEDPYSQALCQKILSALALSRGNFSDAVSLATAAEDGLRSTNDYSNLIYILLDRTEIAVKGNHDLLGARQFVDQAAEIASLHNGNKGHLRILNNKASIEGAAGDVMAACGYLGEVLEIDLRPGMLRFEAFLEALRGKAVYEVWLGNFETARALIASAVKFASESEHDSFVASIASAYVEISAGEAAQARLLLESQMQLGQGREDRQAVAMLWRALGEVALLEGSPAEAKQHFSKAVYLCKTMGMPLDLLYVSKLHWYTFPGEFWGWAKYLDEKI